MTYVRVFVMCDERPHEEQHTATFHYEGEAPNVGDILHHPHDAWFPQPLQVARREFCFRDQGEKVIDVDGIGVVTYTASLSTIDIWAMPV